MTIRLLLGLTILLFWTHGARAQAEPEPVLDWAYASFFGTGWYKISESRSAYILKAAPRWTKGESGIDDQGNRELAVTYRMPVTIGLTRFDFDDISGIIDSDNLSTAGVGFSADVDVPVTPRFSVRPSAEIGWNTVLDESESAWVYRLDLRSRYSFETGDLEWALLGDIGVVGHTPDQGRSDDFTFVALAAEFGYPVSWFGKSAGQTMFYWSVAFTDYIDEVEFRAGIDKYRSVANYWQFAAAIGKRNSPIRVWFLNFDRLGLAYNYSESGELRGIKLVFRSLYEL